MSREVHALIRPPFDHHLEFLRDLVNLTCPLCFISMFSALDGSFLAGSGWNLSADSSGGFFFRQRSCGCIDPEKPHAGTIR